MQLLGQLITDDGERIGLVRSVVPATVPQSDLLVKDRNTGEVVERISRPALSVETVRGSWEDGSDFELTQTVDPYINLGSVVELSKGETSLSDEAAAAVSAVAARFGDYANEVRAAAPLAAASKEAERTLDVVEDEG
jgi:hypothetical protein